MRQALLALSLLVVMTSSLQADLIYGFRFSPTTTSVSPGTQTIDIFLDQSGSGVTPDIANLHTLGLGTANFTVISSNPAVAFSGGSTGFVNGAEGGLVGSSLDLSTPGTAIFAQASLADPGTVASGTLAASGSNTLSSILIGTLTFNLSAGQSTTLTTSAFTLGDFGLANGDLINTISQANLTITAVPEPSSLALLGLVGSSAILWRRRK